MDNAAFFEGTRSCKFIIKKFLIPHFSFLVPHFSFLVPHSSLLINFSTAAVTSLRVRICLKSSGFTFFPVSC